MSSGPWDRQGSVGDLHSRPKAELLELLRRQVKMQTNSKLVRSLPDKGKRIDEFVQKLKAAIAYQEKVEQTAELLSGVKLELQAKQVEMTSDKGDTLTREGVTSTPTAGQVVTNRLLWNEAEKDQYALPKIDEGDAKEGNSRECIEDQESNGERPTEMEIEQMTAPSHTAKDSTVENRCIVGVKQEENNCRNLHNTTNATETDFDRTANLLNDKFCKVSLAENEHRKVNKKMPKDPIGDVKFNPFQTLHCPVKKALHYVDVLQHRAMNPVVKKAHFKTNQPISESPGSSPDQSPGRSEQKLSFVERRRRNQKHLDEITAARLPPLYHSPAQLLSVEESSQLQIGQRQKYESIQAKLAAEKLSEKMNIKMVNLDLGHEVATAYQGYRDQGHSSSSEDDY
ncbi:protein GRINL1A isoform X2 [Narcine bancroftii]|uniref:protein GRINL1A isoform X2 n=1 Tax=Narcine bancroftii TaxID=1343680 RepID=UPI003831C3C3